MLNGDEKLDYDPEEYNRKILEQAAITISAEGTSKDLKGYLQKRITHNRIILNNLTQIMDMTLSSSSKKIKETAYEKEGPIWILLNHAVKEVIRTDDMLDTVLFHIIHKEFQVPISKKDRKSENVDGNKSEEN
jgi:hypothetical protein